jgi:hypothetical protein
MLHGLTGGRAAVDTEVQPGDVAVTGKLAAHLAHEPKDAQPLLGLELLNSGNMARGTTSRWPSATGNPSGNATAKGSA